MLPNGSSASAWSSQEQQAQSRLHQISTDSWCSPSVVSSPSSSLPGAPGGSSSSVNMTRPTDRPNSLSNVSPVEAAGIIALLEGKSVDELRKLLSDKNSYQNLLLSLEPVKTHNRVRDELRNETLQLARDNLEKEPLIVELRNQCRIIRTTELAAAQEKLHELERKKEDALKFYSPSSLVHRLQEAMNETEDESEALHRQLLDRELDITAFVQKYKKMRLTYHKRALTHLAMQTPVPSRA
ncbi:vacuolar protein-sorting-associated protein 37 homolog 1-like [Salvia miltiorrhiza]|uniref:vacuolar protein-sorting-associated protein 37 homolog 1-like n=1 Tax=Salvia miltiorrhiza TaxID=226208 RepID=UPI0025AC472C|nr:vacuolar protein-sorting-associated protein 37 homolog 1-like [Salvia miltiorrhiza]